MINRILPIFKRNSQSESVAPIWEWCLEHNSKVEMTEENLENMANTELVFGFFGGSITPDDRGALVKLAQAVGVCGVQNPEGGANPCAVNSSCELTDSELLWKIGTKIKINLPDFVGGRKETMTDYGIITARHCYNLWILKRIIDLFPLRSDRRVSVIEIGAGMGLLGYFLSKIGHYDYTIIDLANANAIQAYFYHKNLPEKQLILSGEVKNPFDSRYSQAIKILHASDFENIPTGRFNIMINMDGLTEMNPGDAFRYVNSDCAKLLLSINHDMNDFRVIDICKTRKLEYRYPFWIRDGYVEELYTSIYNI